MRTKEERNAYVRNWYHTNPEGRQRILDANKRAGRKLKLDTFAAYGGAICACCGTDEEEFLTLDHIEGNGAEHRRTLTNGASRGGREFYRLLRKNGYPEGYQVLCYNCNIAKSAWGACPHERKPEYV